MEYPIKCCTSIRPSQGKKHLTFKKSDYFQRPVRHAQKGPQRYTSHDGAHKCRRNGYEKVLIPGTLNISACALA